MLSILKTFFYPVEYNYSYNLPKEKVVEKLKEVFKKKTTLISLNDTIGYFRNDSEFEMTLLSAFQTIGLKQLFSLIGKIIEPENGMTGIDIKLKPSLIAYLLFFSSIVLSQISLFKFIVSSSIQFGIGFLILLCCSLLVVGISNAGMAKIYKRYETDIDKVLRI